MARDDAEDPGESIRRQIGRRIANWLLILASLGVIVGWGAAGFYTLGPGEQAVILLLGEYRRTDTNPGVGWHWPPPLEYHEVVDVSAIRREKFGFEDTRDVQPGEATATFETAIQTADRNIVNLAYVLQYRVDDPFSYLYALARPEETLRDAAQAAVRAVVGSKGVDEVLYSARAEIQAEAQALLQETIDRYFEEAPVGGSAFRIQEVSVQLPQPPAPVQDAFDDVVAAAQDKDRAESVARGDAREILEQAGAESREILEAAHAYKDAKILDARGEANRFTSLQAEYARAPEVTRRRLYLETMESLMPGVDKVIVEPDAVSLMPMLPFGGAQSRAPRAPAAVATPPPVPSRSPAQSERPLRTETSQEESR